MINASASTRSSWSEIGSLGIFWQLIKPPECFIAFLPGWLWQCSKSQRFKTHDDVGEYISRVRSVRDGDPAASPHPWEIRMLGRM